MGASAMTPKGPAYMSKAEYGEPWTYDRHPTNGAYIMVASDGKTIAYYGISGDYRPREARAIACVNALAGIPHPSALPALIEACERHLATGSPTSWDDKQFADFWETRAALLDALRAVQPQQATSKPCAKCGQQFVTNYEGPSRELINICNQCWPGAVAMSAERDGAE
jgi:hypothetical protein